MNSIYGNPANSELKEVIRNFVEQLKAQSEKRLEAVFGISKKNGVSNDCLLPEPKVTNIVLH